MLYCKNINCILYFIFIFICVGILYFIFRVRIKEVRWRAGIERELASRADQSIEMVWAYGKNGGVPYGQKGVDFGSKWRAGTRETEVRLDKLCEGGHGK